MEQNIEPDIFGEQLSESEIFEKTFEVDIDKKTIELIDLFENKEKLVNDSVYDKKIKALNILIKTAKEDKLALYERKIKAFNILNRKK